MEKFDSLVNNILDYGVQLRSGKTTCEATTRGYLERIQDLNPKLGAFVHVAKTEALNTARGLDLLLSSGVDLGLLMGVPVAVKDLFAVSGMPTHAGSELPVENIVGPEGNFIKKLKRAGCVILGKTRTVEFAAGAQNLRHRTPWNPSDLQKHRTPGGSSSGSAVAVAAQLCSFAIGSDTGGSVRLPAAMCGVFGFKSSTGLWPLNGVFPLCPAMDTIGILADSAEDTALIFETLTGCDLDATKAEHSTFKNTPAGLRIGVPGEYFLDDLDPEVHAGFQHACAVLEDNGATLQPIEFPEVMENEVIFGRLVPADLLATLSGYELVPEKKNIDPVAFDRLMAASDLSAGEYIRLQRRLQALEAVGTQRMEELDAWISPTSPILPREVAKCSTLENALAFNRLALRNTRPGNMYGFCATSLPFQTSTGTFPLSLQIHCPSGQDATLLNISQTVSPLIHKPEILNLRT